MVGGGETGFLLATSTASWSDVSLGQGALVCDGGAGNALLHKLQLARIGEGDAQRRWGSQKERQCPCFFVESVHFAGEGPHWHCQCL